MRLALLCLNFGELLGLVPQLVVVVPEDNLHLGSSLAPYLPLTCLLLASLLHPRPGAFHHHSVFFFFDTSSLLYFTPTGLSEDSILAFTTPIFSTIASLDNSKTSGKSLLLNKNHFIA